MKKSDSFLISAQNIDCRYSLEPHLIPAQNIDCRNVLEPPRIPTIYVLNRNKKNNVYPCKPKFYYMKVRFKGVKIILACFRDENTETEKQNGFW